MNLFDVQRWRQRARTLKVRLAVVGFAALALGIALTTWALLARVEADTLVERQRIELGESVRSARLLQARVVALQNSLAAAATQLPTGKLADAAALQEFLQSKPVLRTLFDGVFVVSLDGELLLLSDDKGYRRPGRNIADRPYFRTAVDQRRPVVSEPLISRVSAEPLVVFAYPVQVAGKVAAVLGGSLRFKSRDLLANIADTMDGDEDQLSVVTDATGQILAHPDPRHLATTLANEPRLLAAFEQWQRLGRPLEPAGLNLGDAHNLAVAAAVPGVDWMVWRQRPASAVLAPLAAGRRAAIRWAITAVAVLAALMLLLHAMMLKPLERLRDRAQTLFDGSVDPHAGWPGASGEIGDLERVLRHVAAERAQLEAFNHGVNRKLESVMAAAPDGIAFTRDQRFELVSGSLCKMLQRPEEDMLGQPARTIFASDADYAALGPQVGAAFAAGRAYAGEMPMCRRDGSPFWARLRGLPVDPQDMKAGTIWTIQDISEEMANRHALEWEASHDALTGVANRKACEQRMGQVLAALPKAMPAALVVLDLDRFKPVNDTHGHAAGDAVLRAVAGALGARVRTGDLVARLGGDEFAVLLERCPNEVAARIGEGIREAIAGLRVEWNGTLLSVGASVGVAALVEDYADPAAWMAAADAACYAAKSAGRDTVRHAGERLRLVVGGNESSLA